MLLLTALYKFTKQKLVYCLILMLLVSLLEGVGILLIRPLMELINPVDKGGIYGWLNTIAHYLGFGFTFPLILLIYVGVGVVSAYVARTQTMLSINIQQAFVNHLSARLFSAISLAKWEYIISQTKANFINCLTTELLRVSGGVSVFLQLIASSTITIIQILISLCIAPKLTLLVFVCGVIIFSFFFRFTRQAKKVGSHLLYSNQQLMLQITEHLNGIKEIKSYALHAQELDKFKHFRATVSMDIVQNTQIQSKVTFLYKIIALLMVSSGFLIAVQIYHTPMDTMIMLLFVFAKIWPNISGISNLLSFVMGVSPALHNIINIENGLIKHREENVVMDAATQTQFILMKQIEFKQVYFRYKAESKRYNLTNVSFTLPAGSTTAIVGLSGAGKSTLADLLIGLLSPESGHILIDGQNLADNNDKWRKSIAYVPQDVFIFNATLRNNVSWSASLISDTEIWEALRTVALDNFVRQLPRQLDTIVGDRGVLLSGGEKQRLVLARALLRRPSVLILDEATSSLDNYHEQAIQAAIDSYHGKMTICIIAHRLSTVATADQIIVLKNGRVEEIGTYKSLLDNSHSSFSSLHGGF